MIPISFPEANGTLNGGTAEKYKTTDDVADLPVHRPGDGQVISCWSLSDAETFEVLRTQRVWLSVMAGQTHHPVMLLAESPFGTSAAPGEWPKPPEGESLHRATLELWECAKSHEGRARLLGNVTAFSIQALCEYSLNYAFKNQRATAAEARNAELLSGLEKIRDAIPSGGTISHYPAEIAELRTRAETAEAELAEAKAAVERLTRQKETLSASGGRRIDHLQDQLNEATASERRWREEWELLRSAVLAILNYPGESARLRDAVGSILYDRLVVALDAAPEQSDQDSGQHQGTPVEDKPGPRPMAAHRGEDTTSSATAPAAGNVTTPHDDPDRNRVVGPDAGRAIPDCPHGVGLCTASCPRAIALAHEHEMRAKHGDSSPYCCERCFGESGIVLQQQMICCPKCGNKRCPKATNHELACTGSNEPGQVGAPLGGPDWRPEGEHELDRVTADSSPLGIVSDAYTDHTGKYRETALSKQNVIELLIRAAWQLARKVDRLEQSERAAGSLAK